MEVTTKKKSGVGKRRIPIQKIANKTNRNVTFSKRKAGLFKKATELSTLCGSEIAVVVFSETGKVFTFGHPSADSVVQRYVGSSNSSNSSTQSSESGISPNPVYAQFGLDKDYCIDRMGLDELKLYSNHLQNIHEMVAAKMESDMALAATTSTDESNHGNPNTSITDLFVQENSFEMHSNNLQQLTTTLDAETALTVVGDTQQLMTTSDDFYVQEFSKYMEQLNNTLDVDDVQMDDLDFSKYTEELIDFYHVKSPVVDSPPDAIGDRQLGDCFKWKGGYEQSDLLPSSSISYVDVDVEWANSMIC